MSTFYYDLPEVYEDDTLSIIDGVNALGTGIDASLDTICGSFETHHYSLPYATTEQLGGVVVGDGLEVFSDGNMRIEGGSYKLPKATDARLGGVIVGKNFDVTEQGKLSLAGSGAIIPDNSITTPKFAGGAVTTAKLGNQAATQAKMPVDEYNKLVAASSASNSPVDVGWYTDNEGNINDGGYSWGWHGTAFQISDYNFALKPFAKHFSTGLRAKLSEEYRPNRIMHIPIPCRPGNKDGTVARYVIMELNPDGTIKLLKADDLTEYVSSNQSLYYPFGIFAVLDK